MTTARPSGAIQTSVLISPILFELCKKNNIKFTEALRVGASVLLAERDVCEYDNNLNLFRKMKLYQQQASEALQKISELEEVIKLKT